MTFTDGRSVAPPRETGVVSATGGQATIDSTGPGDRTMALENADTNCSLASRNTNCHGPKDKLSVRSVNVATPVASVVTCVFPPRPRGNVSLTDCVRAIAVGTLSRLTTRVVGESRRGGGACTRLI